MATREETTALLGYGRGVLPPPRFSETPPTPPMTSETSTMPSRTHFEVPEASPLLQKQAQEGAGGLSVFTVVCYIMGLLGVTPLVSLPGAIIYCGWLGFVLFGVLVAVEVYTAVLLARSWLMMELFWPREAVLQRRYPFAALAEKVGGVRLRRFVMFLQNLSLFGAAVPFLLLASETLQRLVWEAAGVRWSVCYWLLVISLLMLPLLLLGTPRDLGVVTWLGAGSVVVVSGLTLASVMMGATGPYEPPPSLPSWASVAYCFGAVAFQFDIHPVLLTVQTEMRQKHRLPLALGVACGGKFFVFSLISKSTGYNALRHLTPAMHPCPLGSLASSSTPALYTLCFNGSKGIPRTRGTAG